MHLEFLVEELSMRSVLDNLLPRMVINNHTYRVITYQGKTDLLRKLPSTLKAYSKWIDKDFKIIVVVDLDKDDCHKLKERIEKIAIDSNLIPKSQGIKDFNIMIRIAMKELESWLLGDPDAIKSAYPKIGNIKKSDKLNNPDAIDNTWEYFEKIFQSKGYFKTGLRKIEVANNISSFMEPIKNKSKSFNVFWTGIVEILK
ncbi:MAG: DUF4276 family protein [Candidatus Kapabacteria bacterium]|nr:DUF4276 family protein [Candidatus Kapabacteria bacterium]